MDDLSKMNELQLLAQVKNQQNFMLTAQRNLQALQVELDKRVAAFEKGEAVPSSAHQLVDRLKIPPTQNG